MWRVLAGSSRTRAMCDGACEFACGLGYVLACKGQNILSFVLTVQHATVSVLLGTSCFSECGMFDLLVPKVGLFSSASTMAVAGC